MDCLDTPVILRHILQQFANKELIQLSLVNKLWNYEARCVLRDRGTLTAWISSGRRDRDLVAFGSDLEQMHVVPFSGICLRLDHFPRRCHSASDASYNVILERLLINKFSVDFSYNWDGCTDCPGLLLAEKIVEKFSPVLAEMSFAFNWFKNDRLPDCFTNFSFPCLKTLELKGRTNEEDFSWVAKRLVSCAPDLKVLKMARGICFDENVLEGSSAVLVPGVCFNPLFERVCEDLVPALRPESMEISVHEQAQNFKKELLNRHIPSVLQVSVATLRTLKMDLLVALPLMCYGICLENVTTLVIRLNDVVVERLEEHTLTLVTGFDFTRIFPKVTNVEIEGLESPVISESKVDAFVDEARALRDEALGDRVINIKHVTLCDSIWDSTMPVLAQMFPDVKKLSVKTGDNFHPTPFTALWEDFWFLQELNVISRKHPGSCRNLDSLFCGIFPEEVAELRKKDDEYLKAVNIIPVMPSIRCMKDLKTFTFRYTPEPITPGPGIHRPTFWFSKVTGFIGFASCPNLAVTFQTRSWRCEEALSHMKPFATFVEFDSLET